MSSPASLGPPETACTTADSVVQSASCMTRARAPIEMSDELARTTHLPSQSSHDKLSASPVHMHACKAVACGGGWAQCCLFDAGISGCTRVEGSSGHALRHQK